MYIANYSQMNMLQCAIFRQFMDDYFNKNYIDTVHIQQVPRELWHSIESDWRHSVEGLLYGQL